MNKFEDFNKLLNNESFKRIDENLPSMLFALKNSAIKKENITYHNIKNLFKEISGFSFDVVNNYTLNEENKDYMLDEIQLIIIDKDIYETTDVTIENAIFYPIDDMGSGLEEILYQLVVMHNRDFIILDEPAQCVHPYWQKKIMSLIVEESKNKQFIVITHSPYLLPDLIENEKLKIFHFSYNNSQKETLCNEIETSIFEDPKYKKFKKELDRKKELFFANLNLLVEGWSDEIILPRIIEEFKWDLSYATNNIQIISSEGDKIQKIAEILNSWKLPVTVMVDNDKKEIIKELPETIQYILLPSDIEGTLIIGKLLWNLKDVLGKYYKPKDLILKLNPSGNSNQKNITDLIKLFKNIKTKYTFVNNIETIIDCGQDSEIIRKLLECHFDYNNIEFDKIRNKLKIYKSLIDDPENGKIEIALKMVNEYEEEFLNDLPIQFEDDFKKVFNEVQ